jgi:hypothetical protein
VNDKTRLNGLKSFITPNEAAITLVEIEPEAAAGYLAVTSAKYLDWQYATAGTKTATIRITTNAAPVSTTKTVTVVTAAADHLFSSDSDLVPHEVDILKYVAAGRNTFLDKHRKAQDRILAMLDEMRIFHDDGTKLEKADIIDIDEVRQWSTFLTLQIILEGLSNAINDVFAEKAKKYSILAESAKNRSVLRLDNNADGEVTSGEYNDMRSFRILRR